jgi:hypothetical protein
MKINSRETITILLLAVVGAIFLAFGGSLFGLDDLIRGNISVFIFSLTIMYFTFSLDKWKKNKENEDKRKGILKGIYQEIV